MRAAIALVFMITLLAIGFFVGPYARLLFVIVIPYTSFAIFLCGIVYRVALWWGRVPVPFSIGLTCGQQKSLPWVKSAFIDNPSTFGGVILRMALEVCFFRSLFRNGRTVLNPGTRPVFEGDWLLWVSAMAFHSSMLLILVRHLRFFLEPVPFFVPIVQYIDGFFEIGVPVLYVSGPVLLIAASSLLFRRLLDSRLRYVSLPADYFPLFLVMGIAGSGIVMRHFSRTDVATVKEITVALCTFRPVIPDIADPILYSHVFVVCVLLAYFPFSKLTHMVGVFMSPTRNLRCNSREFRHINPWNHPVRVRSYAQYEDEFRDKMVSCDLPVDWEDGATESKCSVSNNSQT